MTASENQNGPARVAIVGGGLAGLAAAAALCERGLRVELFEARRRLGGRAGSFRDSVSGRLVDACQHVAMGCCTNLADLLRRTGTSHCFRRQRRLHFIGPDGRRYGLSATPLLPAPLHLVPGLMRLGYLGLADRLRILRTIGRLAKPPARSQDDKVTIGSWLRCQGEPDRAIRRFWSVVLVSALSDTLDRVSLPAARKVLVDGFLASRRAYELMVPRAPLDEIYNRRVADWLRTRDVTIHRGVRIQKIEGDARRPGAVVLPDGSQRPFDLFVAAVPWRSVRALFPESLLDALPALADVEGIEPAPITAVHLWLDRPITHLREAVLVGRLGQWLFSEQAADRAAISNQQSHYYQVVISASHELRGRNQEHVARQVKEELDAIWPAARRSELLRWRVVTNPEAVFSARPGVDGLRPPQQTPIRNLVLAGDWTSTGWPATMEGAVRSGYLAAEAILNHTCPGSDHRLLASDLHPGGLARWLIRAGTDG